MAARPRRFDLGVKNLYCRRDNRNGEVYYQYRDPRNGRFFGLGKDRDLAKERASSLNLLIAEQISEALMENIVNSGSARKSTEPTCITFGAWAKKYIVLQEKRLESGEIRKNTFKARKSQATLSSNVLGNIPLNELTTKDCYTLIESYKEQGKARTAQSIRSGIIDMYKEAAQAGEVSGGYNPALATKMPKSKVKRSRLSLEDFEAAREKLQIKISRRWVENAILLALVTGQRRDDVISAQFRKGRDWDGLYKSWHEGNQSAPPYSYVDGDHFYIFQRKTGSMISLPLNLKLNAINMSIGEVINKCRDGVVAKNIIHHTSKSTFSEIGGKTHADTVSRHFTGALKSN